MVGMKGWRSGWREMGGEVRGAEGGVLSVSSWRVATDGGRVRRRWLDECAVRRLEARSDCGVGTGVQMLVAPSCHCAVHALVLLRTSLSGKRYMDSATPAAYLHNGLGAVLLLPTLLRPTLPCRSWYPSTPFSPPSPSADSLPSGPSRPP
jgi:hypothetical protein